MINMSTVLNNDGPTNIHIEQQFQQPVKQKTSNKKKREKKYLYESKKNDPPKSQMMIPQTSRSKNRTPIKS